MPIHQDAPATLRPELTVCLMEYASAAAQARFIADLVLPVFPSPTDTGEYAVFKRENLLHSPDTARKEGGYNRINADMASQTFVCEEHGLEFEASDKKARKYSRFLDLETAGATMIFHQILVAREKRVAALLAAGLTSHNASVNWATIATADPIADVRTAANVVMDACGIGPDELSLVISRTDHMYLSENAKMLARLVYTNAGTNSGMLNLELLAKVFGIGQVVVGMSGYNSKAKGGTVTVSQIWGTGTAYVALLGRAGQAIEQPCLGRQILWTGDSPELPVVESYRDNVVRANIVRVRHDSDEILQGVDPNIFAYKINTTGA